MNLILKASPIFITLIVAGCGSTGEVKSTSAWNCSAKSLVDSSYNGGSYANIHLSAYSSGGDYKVKLNSSKTIASGKTADGTLFTCSKK